MTIVAYGYGIEAPTGTGTSVSVGDATVQAPINVELDEQALNVVVSGSTSATANGAISVTLETLEFNADLNPGIDVTKDE